MNVIKNMKKQYYKEQQYLKRLEEDDNKKYFMRELCWKASMFDCLNDGVAVYDINTGKFIEKYPTQIEASRALMITPYQVSAYLSGKAKSRKYLFKVEPYYTFEEWYSDESEN